MSDHIRWDNNRSSTKQVVDWCAEHGHVAEHYITSDGSSQVIDQWMIIHGSEHDAPFSMARLGDTLTVADNGQVVVREATLMIGLSSSTCSNCHRGCNPYESHHYTILSYNRALGNSSGCGARYTAMVGTYLDLTEDKLKRMRPDLPVLS